MGISQHPFQRRVALVGTTAACLALIITGCTTSSGGTDSAGGTDTIRSVFAADPHTFAPFDGSAVDDYVAASLMFEPLVYKDDGNTFVPGLAASWDVQPTHAEFTLRKGATCGDGTPVTATMVKDSLQAYAHGKSSFTSPTFGPGEPTFTADDDAGTVSVELAQPWTDLLAGLSLPAAGIVCTPGLADQDALAAGTVDAATTGPYTLEKKQPGVRYEFALRKDYDLWPEYAKPLGGTAAQTISFTVGSEGSASANELLTGSMDVAIVRGKDMMRLENSSKIDTDRIPAANLFLLFNERDGHPFTDVDKRRAVAQALDRDAFNQATNGGLGELSASFALPAVPCYNQDDSMLVPRDTDAAAKALKGMKIKLLGSQAFGPNGAANTYVAEALREAGADVDLQNVDNATWSANGRQKPDSWDIVVFGNINAAATMWGVMSLFVGPSVEDGGTNWTGNEDPTLQKDVAKAMSEADDDARCGIYDDAQRTAIQKQVRVVPLSTLASIVATRHGFTMRAPNKTREDMTMRIEG